MEMEINLGDLLKMAMEEIDDEKKERLKLKVADLDPEMAHEFMEFKKESRVVRDEMKIKLKSLELEYKRRVQDEIEPLTDKLESLHDEAWGKVYKRYGLNPEMDYNVNMKDKSVYQYME